LRIIAALLPVSLPLPRAIMPEITGQQGDVIFIERRREPRIIVSMPARYALANRRDSQGNRREFDCRIVNISLRAVTLMAPVNGAVGERVIVSCDAFGRLEGTVVRVLELGFVMQVAVSQEAREKLAAKIEWYEKNKNHDLSENRQHKRVAPKNPHSKLVLDDGRVLECFVIDVSASGAAVAADVKPAIGTPLAIGKLVGRVVRHLDDGFAVKFVELQDPEQLEDRLALS
jgi:PilZ domain